MRKKIFLFVFSLIISFPLFPENGIQFLLEPYVSYFYADLGEHLYDYDTKREVSYLDWEANRIISLGICGLLNLNNFSLLNSICFGLPFECGQQTNEDFSSNTGISYNFTEEELTLQRFINTDIILNWKKNVYKNLNFLFSLSFDYNQTKLKGDIGEGIHSGRPVKVYPANYERNTFYSFVGLGIGYDFCKMSMSIFGYISPYTYICSYDTHTGSKRDTIYRDRLETYWKRYKFVMDISYSLSDKLSVVTKCNIIYGGAYGKGDLYTTKYSDTLEKDLKGTNQDMLIINTSLGLRYNF